MFVISSKILNWFKSKNWKIFPFQKELWEAYSEGYSGILNAPTGSGKTYAVWFGILLSYLQNQSSNKSKQSSGLKVLWITPLRALTKDIEKSLSQAVEDLDIPWEVGSRTGDTSSSKKQTQRKKMPECLVTTPESLHILLAQKGYPELFRNLEAVVVDEWHELIGSKRGILIELGLSRLRSIKPNIKIWGISATIGNLDDALKALIGFGENIPTKIIKSEVEKKIEIETILPDKIERFPWSGHLGTSLIPKMIPLIRNSKTTLIFTNTRSHTEIWYQRILAEFPAFAGEIAIHHGSLDNELRNWVEESLHNQKLKVVICTSSLDLGVDFRPVETIFQIGSPKSVARFLQRAGRSGHQPGAISKIYFVPTNSLELIEAAAIKQAINEKHIEKRYPLKKSYDVLTQYLVTLAVSEGFHADDIYKEIITTNAFKELTRKEFDWIINFITTGGKSLRSYDQFLKVENIDGVYKVTSKKIALRHRLSIGTIMNDSSLKVQYLRGGYLGTIEESFISKLEAGTPFWFTGKSLEVVRIKDMTVWVRSSKNKNGVIPKWLGGRLPLSSSLAEMIRLKLNDYLENKIQDIEIKKLEPLLELQNTRSKIPGKQDFLIEKIKSREGYHLFFYPFEGRVVHEIISSLVAYRISQMKPITFSIAMNDYGFELLSDQEIPIEEALRNNLFSIDNLLEDITKSINSIELSKRRFREIARISGLIFQGYPGRPMLNRHLQASAELFYEVFKTYDPENLLLKQSFEEVLTFNIEEPRVENALKRISSQKIILTNPIYPTPFAFPIMVDRLREKLSSEKLEDRIKRMVRQYEKT